MKLILIAVIALIVGLGIGLLIGEHHSSKQLAECHKENVQLFQDLVTAVQRGVILETNLTLCKEAKK